MKTPESIDGTWEAQPEYTRSQKAGAIAFDMAMVMAMFATLLAPKGISDNKTEGTQKPPAIKAEK